MTIELKMLGDFCLLHNGKSVALTKSKRTRALLAYLAMTSRPQRRESLCELLWDLPNDPKGALRWSLSKIRPLVNDNVRQRLVADRERVTIMTDDIKIDVHDIRTALQSKETLPIALLSKYLNELATPFLEGIDLPSQERFQRWLVAERIEIERLYTQVIDKLSAHPKAPPKDKIRWLEYGLEKEPYNTKFASNMLHQLHVLGLHDEQKAMRLEFTKRFDKAELPWDPSEYQVPTNQIPSNDSKSLLQRQQIKFCSTSDKVRIAYTSVGEGFPIVKAANWLSHLEYDWDAPIWSPLFQDLAQDHRIIRYDERGNGLSDWNVSDISFNAFVADLETVVKTTGLEKFALLGISQGASVSIQYAINHPDKVSHLILFGAYAAGWKIDSTENERKQREAIITLTESGWGQDNPAYRQIFSTTFMPSANKQELDWFNNFQKQTTSPENAARFLSVFGDIDVRDLLAEVKVPTLVIHSLGDMRIPVEVGKTIATQIPNAEFVGLPSDGHLLLGREPASDMFVKAVKDFIAQN